LGVSVISDSGLSIAPSKNHFQSQLNLPRSLSIGSLERVSRNLVMTGIVVDSQQRTDLDEVRGITLQTVLGDQDALVVAIQQIEGF
jgi:hypothetical protein